MPINERGEYIREQRSRPWGFYFLLAVLALAGGSTIWDYITKPKQTTSTPKNIPLPPPPAPAPLDIAKDAHPPSVPAIEPPPPAPAPATKLSHEVMFSNRCSQAVKVFVSYTDLTDRTVTGFYDFAPGQASYLADRNNTRIKVVGREIFYFARMAIPDRDYNWEGQFPRVVDGVSYKMRRAEAGSDQTVISALIDCGNFWRVTAKNACDEELEVAFLYPSLEPGRGWTTAYWWSLSPNEERTFPLRGGGFVELISPPGGPAEFYYFARSRTHTWDARTDERSKMASIDGRTVNMVSRQLTMGATEPHVTFTCRPPRPQRETPTTSLPSQPPPLETDPVARIRNKLAFNGLDQSIQVSRLGPNRVGIAERRNISRSEAETVIQIVKTENAANPGLAIEVPCSIGRQAGQPILNC